MRAFRAMTVNVVRSSMRNRVALFFTLGLAVFFMVIFGLLFNTNGVNLHIGVADEDGTQASRALVAALEKVDGVSVDTGSQDAELDNLHHDHVVIVAVIPKGFGAAAGGQGAAVQVGVFAGAQVSEAASIADQILIQVTGQVAAQYGGSGKGAAVSVAPPKTASVNEVRTIDFFLPGMIGYIILQSGINYVAIGVVELRVRQVLRRLRATPITAGQILGSQVTGGMLTVVLQVIVLVAVGLGVFGARMYGSWLVAAVPIALGTAAFVGIGFLLTSAARTSEAARGLAAMVAFPMMFLSGVFFPVSAFPGAIQGIVRVLPLTWLTDALRQVMNDGAGLTSIAGDCAVLAGWAVVTLILATWRFRWD